jgi:hypothetical protein
METNLHWRVVHVAAMNLDEAEAFYASLQAKAAKDDAKALSAMVHYPLNACIHKKNVKIASQKAFMSHYKELFNVRVKSKLKTQSFDDLFANDEGVMVGDGEIWFTQYDLKGGKLSPIQIESICAS